MKNKMIKNQILSLLIPGCIIAFIICIFALYCGFLTPTCYYYGNSDVPKALEHIYYGTGNISISHFSSIDVFCVVLVLCAAIMPVMVMNYRTSLKKTDLLYQAPFREGTIKKTRIIVGLLYLIIAVTIAFILLNTLYLTRLFATPLIENTRYIDFELSTRYSVTVRMQIDFGVLFLSYFALIVLTISAYSFGLFFASRAIKTEHSIISLITGFVLFELGAWFVLSTIGQMFDFNYVDVSEGTFKFVRKIYELKSYDQYLVYSDYALRNGFGPFHTYAGISPFIISNIFKLSDYSQLEFYGLNDGILYIPTAVTTSVIGLIVSLGLGIYAFFEGEPSGEVCKLHQCRSKTMKIVHHVTFGILLTSLSPSSLGSDVGGIICYLIGLTVYFLLTAWINSSFKFKKADIISMICNVCGSITVIVTIWALFWTVYYPPIVLE